MSMYALQTCQNTQGPHLLQLNPVHDSTKPPTCSSERPGPGTGTVPEPVQRWLGSQNLMAAPNQC